HFIVQKGSDGRKFTDLAVTDAKEDFQAARSFSFTDKAKVSGTVYYRLAMVDKDGTVVYSQVVMISSKPEAAARIYPTVVQNGNLFVEAGAWAGQVKLEVFDMNGRPIFSKLLVPGRQQVSVAANGV